MDGIDQTPAVPSWVVRKRFDVTDYHRMAATGLLAEDDRYELIEGELIEMAPIGGPHIGAVIALSHLLVGAAGNQFRVSIQNSLRLGQFSEPEPDLTLLRPRADGYRGDSPPTAEDAALVIEVADSSLAYDRQVKALLYARHGLPEFWIIDLVSASIEVYRAPANGAFASMKRYVVGEAIEPLCMPGVRIAVRDVLLG